ncbi:Hypothetical protein LCAKO_1435 [Lacticaseibacillus paracasei subsp. paracasei]|uniref:Uncharacterized protein n=1 Tax=Lacticaseibacillus paracasei subsp. paracasei TaxID=47714 RepID=A0AAP9HHD6_LACPA|nr:hypothetical protein [Lacticaseibacillus paracasei]QGV17960.1 Hypothetical protein LCAKO_1435 [Lacticaseibacillus paracasei subsp. paracasei]
MREDKGTFTSKDLCEYINDHFASGVTRRTVQNWLSLDDDVYPLDTSKKPFTYSIENRDKVIAKHLKKLVPKKPQTVADELLSKKIEREIEEENEYNDRCINEYEKDPEGAEFEKLIDKETEEEFLSVKKEFLLKAILYYLTTNLRKTKSGKELDERLLHKDVETRVILENIGFDNRTIEQDKALIRLYDFKNYFPYTPKH